MGNDSIVQPSHLSAQTLEPTEKPEDPVISTVYKAFQAWRTNKTTSRLPEYLWDKVFILLKHHKMSIGATRLGLSYKQIAIKKIQRQQTQDVDINNDIQDFVTFDVIQDGAAKHKDKDALWPISIKMCSGAIIDCQLSEELLLRLIHCNQGGDHVTN